MSSLLGLDSVSQKILEMKRTECEYKLNSRNELDYIKDYITNLIEREADVTLGKVMILRIGTDRVRFIFRVKDESLSMWRGTGYLPDEFEEVIDITDMDTIDKSLKYTIIKCQISKL